MTRATILGDLKGGLIASPSCLAFSIANGALIYSGTLEPMLGRGIAAGLITTIVVSVLLALTSSFRPVIGTANSTTGAPLGAVLVGLAPSLVHLSPSAAMATVYVFIGLTTVAAGLTVAALGSAKLGKIVRFVPFPVVAGFMGVTGTLLLFGAVRLTTGVPIQMKRLPEFASPDKSALLALLIAFTAVMLVVTRRYKHPLVLPGMLVVTGVAVDLLVYATGHSVQEPPLTGLFLAPKAFSMADLPLVATMPSQAEWHLVWPLLGSIAAYVVLVVMATLLTNTGLEAALNVDADYNRELRVQGLAIATSGMLGGFVGNPSLGSTMAGVTTGATGRVAGLTNGVVMIVFFLVGLRILPFIPRFVIGGLLAQIGVWIIMNWCVATRTKVPLGEWCLILGIVGVTVCAGLVPAIISGLVGGCIVFAFDVSRVNIVQRSYGLDQQASPLVRSGEELAVLSTAGKRVQVIELSGTLFFGSAYQILTHVKHLLRGDKPKMIILDLINVRGCDSSTTAVLARMRRLLQRESVALAVAAGDDRIIGLLRTSNSIAKNDAVYMTLDQALEAAEDFVLTGSGQALQLPSVEDWLSHALGGRHLALSLLPALDCSDYAVGAYLCRQGEPTDSLLFIEDGRVEVLVGAEERCVRVFSHHTIAGEHGFILRQPRTASLKVARSARVWTLRRDSFESLKPDLVIALLCDVVRLQSERLAYATRLNAAKSLDRDYPVAISNQGDIQTA